MKHLLTIFFMIGIVFCVIAQEEDATPKDYHIYSIYFEGGSYYIDDVQIEGLHQFLEKIPNIEQHLVTIHGHTDNIGSLSYNEWLSKMRSDGAFELLIDKNIPADNISVEDFGELNPVYDNSTWEGRQKNRRVDIILKPILL